MPVRQPVLSNAEFESQLKVYEAKRSADFNGWLLVTCPHEPCGGTFIVERKKWYDLNFIGRSCPYCFKTARLPLPKQIKRK